MEPSVVTSIPEPAAEVLSEAQETATDLASDLATDASETLGDMVSAVADVAEDVVDVAESAAGVVAAGGWGIGRFLGATGRAVRNHKWLVGGLIIGAVIAVVVLRRREDASDGHEPAVSASEVPVG